MKILVIGGTRFFGKRFVHRMFKQGHDLTILTRGQSGDDFGDDVKRLKADRTNLSQLKSVIQENYDVVVDNILMTGREAEDIISILSGRVGHYVMTSTISVYDPKPGPLIEDDFEASEYEPKAAESYQEGKRAAEHALLKAPFSVSIMRIPVIVGPDDYTERLLAHVKAVKNEKPLYFPNPEAYFSYLHAEDAARALEWFCERRPRGTFNISAPDAWSLRSLMEQIERIVGKKFEFGESSATPSPFGTPDDYFADTTKARAAGFEVEPLQNWMPDLLKKLSAI